MVPNTTRKWHLSKTHLPPLPRTPRSGVVLRRAGCLCGRVDVQLGNLILKRNIKLADIIAKWVKKLDVSKVSFRKHVLEMGVVCENDEGAALFARWYSAERIFE